MSGQGNFKNILVVTNHFYPGEWGGSCRVVHEVFSRITAHQKQVTIITRRVDDSYPLKEMVAGMEVFRFEVYGSRWLFRYFFVVINTFLMAKKLDRLKKFDIINYHDPFTALGVNLAIRGKRRRLATFHSPFYRDMLEGHPSDGIKNPVIRIAHRLAVLTYASILKSVERYIYLKADKITCLSRFSKEELVGKYGISAGKVEIISGGIDLNKFSSKNTKENLRKKINVSEERVLLFTARRLEKQKGIGLLLYALKEVTKEIPEVFLIIAGKGTMEKELKQLTQTLGLAEFVRFEGVILEGIEDYYQAADFFILPTIAYEPFGLVTLEALASSTPVIGSPYGATNDILKEIDERLLFEPESSAMQMANQIIYMINLWQQGSLKNLAQKCREYVVENYSWEKTTQQTLKLFSRLGVTY